MFCLGQNVFGDIHVHGLIRFVPVGCHFRGPSDETGRVIKNLEKIVKKSLHL